MTSHFLACSVQQQKESGGTATSMLLVVVVRGRYWWEEEEDSPTAPASLHPELTEEQKKAHSTLDPHL